MSVEPDTYPHSTVFVNKLDITDAGTLSEAEASITLARTEEYRSSPSDATFDLDHLRRIHLHLFQDLYEWAGELRNYDTRKGICEFTPAANIERYATQVYEKLAEENYLQDLSRDAFLHRLAYYYDITNRLHPFPEGNGRTQRLFIEELASISGYSMDWSAVHAWEIEETAVRAFEGDREPLYVMFERITTP